MNPTKGFWEALDFAIVFLAMCHGCSTCIKADAEAGRIRRQSELVEKSK